MALMIKRSQFQLSTTALLKMLFTHYLPPSSCSTSRHWQTEVMLWVLERDIKSAASSCSLRTTRYA